MEGIGYVFHMSMCGFLRSYSKWNTVGEGGQFWHKPFLPVCTIRNISVWGRNLGIPGKGALAQASSPGIAKFLVSGE